MIYKYSPNNPARFATNLRRDKTTKNLMWDNANGQDVLIVQTPFGSSAVDYIEEICHLLPNVTLLPEKYTEELTGVWIKFVTAADKARNRGCCVAHTAKPDVILFQFPMIYGFCYKFTHFDIQSLSA